MELEEIKNVLKKELSEKRFFHSLCVMEMCEKLALHYNVNVDDAKLVGLAHDIAKEIPSDEKIKYARENNIPINNVEQSLPTLLHAKIGADICRKQFDFSDKLCKAISLHTTGGENMDMLSKILFIGDGIGLDRTYEEVNYIRDLAFEDLNSSILCMLEFTIKECLEKNKPIHIDTILARNWLLLNK